jgi:hypothetical protein
MARAPRWEPAYCAFFEARQRSFMRTAYAMLGSWPAAEDATQVASTAYSPAQLQALVTDPELQFTDPEHTPPPPANG